MNERVNTATWYDSLHRWQVKVQKDGVRKSFTCAIPGRAGQREANAKADAWLSGRQAPVNCRVENVYPLFIEDLIQRTSRSNWEPVQRRGQKWVLPTIGRIKIKALNEQHLQSVINEAYRKGGLAKKTLCNLRADLYSFIKFCRKSRLTNLHPEDIVIPASAPKIGKEILQPAELSILMSEDTVIMSGQEQVEEYIYGFRLQVLTGLRPGELLGLYKSDLHGDVIHVQRSLNQLGEITSGKNDNAVRSVILSDFALECWNLQASKYPHFKELFPAVNQQTYGKHLKRYCQQYDITPVTPYGLRHTFISIVKTLPEGLIKDLVGHSDQMDTFGVYGHSVAGDNLAIKSAIEDRFAEILRL